MENLNNGTKTKKSISYNDHVHTKFVIVEGREKSWDTYTTVMFHSHCEACITRHCTVKPDDLTSCSMVSCDHGCGAKFHRCLLSEHLELCPEERVPCTNLNYGCPLVMPRYRVGVHLEVCPASVMCCPIEWNRWPMYSVEDKKKMQLPRNILKVNCGQLDVALAMRDQRMLVESLNAPKKTKRILRNHLTTRYPAAPFALRSSSMDSDMLTSDETSQDISDDECGNTPWNLGNYPPGLQRSVCSRLIQATKQTADSLSATLDLASSNMTSSGHSLGVNASSQKAKVPSVMNSASKADPSLVSMLQCQSNGAGQTDVRSDSTSKVCKKNNITSNPNECMASTLTSNMKLCDILGVDINIDCITKYQPKPPEMFTFLCAQEFRRDEYAWHFKNVHNDIQSCLNGWMEQRCPLSYLGCTFSFRRFKPAEDGSSIMHSALLESFGLASSPENCGISLEREPSDCSMDVSAVQNMVDSPVDTPIDPRVDPHVDLHIDHNSTHDPTVETMPVDDCTAFDYDHSPSIVHHPVTRAPEIVHQGAVRPMVPASEPVHQRAVQPITEKQQHVTTVCHHDNLPEVYTSHRAYSPIDVKTCICPSTTHKVHVHDLHLLNLPFEVLQDVARHLDSFSMCNLALVCKLLRDVCCSLLDERGIVIQIWEKVKDPTPGHRNVTWKSYCNTWRFSTAFSPVKKWHFSGHNPIGDHLKTCRFNQTLVRDAPVFVYPPGDAPMSNELRSLLAERQRESVSVKLRELHQWYQQFQEAKVDDQTDSDQSEGSDGSDLDNPAQWMMP